MLTVNGIYNCGNAPHCLGDTRSDNLSCWSLSHYDSILRNQFPKNDTGLGFSVLQKPCDFTLQIS